MILSTFVPPFYYCAIPGIMVASLSQTTIFGAHGCRRWHSSPENVMYLHKQNLCVCKINVAQNNGKRTQSTIRFGFYFAICRSVFIFSFFSVPFSLSRRRAPCTIHSVVCIFYVVANATAIVNHVPCLLSFWIQIVRALSIDVPEIISINKFVSVVCACVCCERNTRRAAARRIKGVTIFTPWNCQCVYSSEAACSRSYGRVCRCCVRNLCIYVQCIMYKFTNTKQIHRKKCYRCESCERHGARERELYLRILRLTNRKHRNEHISNTPRMK